VLTRYRLGRRERDLAGTVESLRSAKWKRHGIGDPNRKASVLEDHRGETSAR